MERPFPRRIPCIPILLAGTILLALFWRWLDGIPLAMASAVVLAPLHNRLIRRIPGWLSAMGITLALLLFLALCTFITIQAMQDNLSTNEEILGEIAGGFETLSPQLTALGIPGGAIRDATDRVEAFVDAIAAFWSSISLGSVLLSPTVLLFFPALALSLWKGDLALRALLRRLPPDGMLLYPKLATVAVDTLYAVLVVHLLIVALTFGISLPFYTLLGYGHVLYFSLVTSFCELVPVLGASVPMVVLLLYAFALGDMRGFLLVFFLGYLTIALLPELTLRPVLMGRRTLLSPLVMFFGFLGGILLLGISGFLLGPLALAVAVAWYRIRREGTAQEKESPA